MVKSVPPISRAVDLLRFGDRVWSFQRRNWHWDCPRIGDQRERRPVAGDRPRRRTGGVHRNAPDASRGVRRRVAEGFADAFLQAFDVVQRMLAEPVRDRIAVPSLLPSGEELHRASHRLPGAGVHDERPDRIGPEVDTEHVRVTGHEPTSAMKNERITRSQKSGDRSQNEIHRKQMFRNILPIFPWKYNVRLPILPQNFHGGRVRP